MNTDPRENKAVQEFIQGSGDSFEALPGPPPANATLGDLFPVIDSNQAAAYAEFLSMEQPLNEELTYFSSIDTHALEEMSEKLSVRRDKWRDRYASVKAQLIQERKRSCLVSGILIDLILKGDLNVVAAPRNR